MMTSRAALARSTRSAYLALSQARPERDTLLLLCKAALATIWRFSSRRWNQRASSKPLAGKPQQTGQCLAASNAQRGRARHFSRLIPREMTRTERTSADTDWVAISILARGDSGMVSVGLNAEELVIEM